MSKTVEIDVYVREGVLERDIFQNVYKDEANASRGGDTVFKAKLVIDVPEKKITITEAEFDKCFGDVVNKCDYTYQSVATEFIYKRLKKNLGL